MRGRTVRTEQNRARFLEALSESGNVRDVCRMLGLSRNAMYEWRADDRPFARDWDNALELGIEALEDEAKTRAMDGSDALLMFLLRGKRPAVYGQKSQIAVTSKQEVDYKNLPVEELQARLAALRLEQEEWDSREPSVPALVAPTED